MSDSARRHSIARRLAQMFALAALAVFALISAALYYVVNDILERHQRAELNTRLSVLEPMLGKSGSLERWEQVSAKLDTLTPGDGSIHFWVASSDPRFEYGAPDAAVRAVLARDGVARLAFDERPHPLKTLVKSLPPLEERPALQFMVAIDTTPFVHTQHVFAAALAALSALGVLLASALGYWIAHIGLAPLGRLSRDAQALSPNQLSQRLDSAPLPRELSELVGSFNGALDRLQHAYTRLECFNADVAHELRTPLANLIGQTQVALSRQRSAAQFEDVLQSNLEELERLRAIVNNMLFLARADRGEMATGLVHTPLAREINTALEFLELIFEEAQVTVRLHGDAGAAVEQALLRRAVANLLHNAARHTAAGGEIVVEIAGRDDVVEIAVSNPGAPIAETHLQRLFERFYRVDPARSNSGENHGLGLSIVKAVALMHGGAVFAYSRDGHNTFGFSVSRHLDGGAERYPPAPSVR